MSSLDLFDYNLPPHLIAQSPKPQRTDSQLLWREHGRMRLGRFAELTRLLRRDDLLVANDTRVLPARVNARKPSGGKVEIMLERILSESQAKVQLGANKKIRIGQILDAGECQCEVIARDARFFIIQIKPAANGLRMHDLFERHGEVPLPPYIDRAATAADAHRYQTVYANQPGAVAAPTAGLHFDHNLLAQLSDSGIQWATLTLHVAAGTFAPLKGRVETHTMHAEKMSVSEDLVAQIHATQARRGRVVAVGTTVVRALETAAGSGQLKPMHAETDLFIRAGFRFRVVDALITNFHLPKSTLLLLVAAFAGLEQTQQYYAYALRQQMRFYSYGDAMLVARQACSLR